MNIHSSEETMRSSYAITSAALIVCVAPLLLALRAAPPDACALLTSAEIDGAMGVGMGAPKSLASKACQWRQPVKQGSPNAIVDVTILDRRRFDIGKAAATSTKFKVTPVSALGDEAYYSATVDGKITDLRVRKGDAGFAVHVWGAGVPIPQLEPKELALAKLIVSKF
jgi:hypothetical protein